jgi:hypothetical protein
VKGYVLYTILTGFTLIAFSARSKEGGRIYFPAEKNGARLLFQKLEYQILDDDNIRLGNMLINTNDVRIELSKSTETAPQFSFFGPSQLMKNSQIIIRDPTGRSVWSYLVQNKDLLESNGAAERESVTRLLKKVDVLRLAETSTEMLAKINNSIFFTYCIFYEEENHRYNICSRDYRLEKSGKKWTLAQVVNAKKDFIVQVNGTEVGSDGTIQISEKLSTISFSSRLASGLLIEFRTGNIPIEVIDSKWDTQSDFAELTIREKNQDDKFNLKQAWSSKVPFTQSYFYLEGESQIPLKQELFFEDKPPSEQVRPNLTRNNFQTYSSSITINFKNAPDIKLKPKTPGDKIVNRTPISEWQLNNIKSEGSNIHFLELSSPNKTYFASYEVLRGRPGVFQIQSLIGQNTRASETTKSTQQDSLNGISLNMDYHFTDFLGIDSNWSQLRWFTKIGYALINVKPKAGEATSIAETSLDLGYRFNYGFHHETPSLAFYFGFFQRKTKEEMANSPSLGLFYKNPSSQLSLLGDQFLVDLKVVPALQYKPSLTKGNLILLGWNSSYIWTEKIFWTWSLEYTSDSLKIQGIQFKVGIGSNF